MAHLTIVHDGSGIPLDLRSLAELRARDEDVELHYSLPDAWKRRLFLAPCRRYGLKPFREQGRRQTTVQVRPPSR